MPYRERRSKFGTRTGALSVWADGDRLDAGLTTIQDFAQLLARRMPADSNEAVVKQAWRWGLPITKSRGRRHDRQEAAIPYQRDGIARRFVRSIEAAHAKRDRASRIFGQGAGQAGAAKEQVRRYDCSPRARPRQPGPGWWRR